MPLAGSSCRAGSACESALNAQSRLTGFSADHRTGSLYLGYEFTCVSFTEGPCRRLLRNAAHGYPSGASVRCREWGSAEITTGRIRDWRNCCLWSCCLQGRGEGPLQGLMEGFAGTSAEMGEIVEARRGRLLWAPAASSSVCLSGGSPLNAVSKGYLHRASDCRGGLCLRDVPSPNQDFPKSTTLKSIPLKSSSGEGVLRPSCSSLQVTLSPVPFHVLGLQ